MRKLLCSWLVRTIAITAGALLTLAGAAAQSPWSDLAALPSNAPPRTDFEPRNPNPGGRPIPGTKQADLENTARNLRWIEEDARKYAAYKEAKRRAGSDAPKSTVTHHVEYTYDADGNLITQTDERGVRRYTYDFFGHMLTAELPGQPLITYDYTSDGLRIAKHQGNTETHYQYDQRSLLAETNVIGNTMVRYHYSATELLSRTIVGSTPRHEFYLLDALGSVIAMISQAGAITSRTRYGAWGEIIAQQDENGVVTHPNTDGTYAELPDADQQHIGFTGYYKDTETGLYYAKARYYDPRVARFTTQDPEEGNPMQPPSLQRYLYAYANPTVYRDPSGRMTEGLLNQELSNLASGRISKEEFRERTNARGVGTLFGSGSSALHPIGRRRDCTERRGSH